MKGVTANVQKTDVILVRGSEGVRLSGVSLARATTPAALRALVRDRFDTDAVLLHDGGLLLGFEGGVEGAPVLMEALGPLPANLTRTAWSLPPNVRPWGRPGWFAEVGGWLEGVLEPRGERVVSVEQVSTYDLACVLRAQTTSGSVYFKASVDGLESIVTPHLAQTFPHLVPASLAVHKTRGWLLTRGSGERLSGAADITVWSDALGKLARFQCSDVNLQALGGAVHNFDALAERAEVFLRDRATLLDWGLRKDQVDALADLSPQIRRAHDRVRALGLPKGPAHGDAQPMNALADEDGNVKWFDWSEAGVAHPLMDVGWCLAWMTNPAREPLPVYREFEDAPARLWRGYLHALGVPDAEGLMGDAVVLAMTHRALVYHVKYATFEGTVPGWRPQYTPYYLKQLLKMARMFHGSFRGEYHV